MNCPEWCPKEIWEAAKEAIEPWLGPSHQYRLDCHEGTARAILAERERCVAVAEHLNGWGADCGNGGHAMHIANTIRGTNANT